MGSLRLTFAFASAVLALVAAAPAWSASASVDLVTLPSSGAGPVESKTWAASLRGAWMKRVTFDVPAAYFNARALDALLASGRTEIGEATVSSRGGDSGTVELGIKVVTGECAPAERGCFALGIRRKPQDRVLLSFETATAHTRGGGVVDVLIRLDNVETASGRLFAVNPGAALRANTWLTIVPCSTYSESRRCGQDGARLHATVRELRGGETSVILRRSSDRALFGRKVVFFGRVIRNGKPAAGERVIVAPYFRREGSSGAPRMGASGAVVTDKRGRFRVTRTMGATSRWGAWASKPRTKRGPKLNTLERLPTAILYVRAPRPGIEKRNAQARSDGQTMAQVVVRNPLPGYHLATVVTVGGVSYRRMMRGTQVVFEVTGPTGAPVQARVFQEHPNPDGGWIPVLLAPSFSRVLSL